MLVNILEKVKSLFTSTDEQSKLDAFITAQRPTTVAEVDHWTRVYDQRQHNNNFINYSL